MPTGVTVEPIRIEDAETVDYYYTYRGEGTLERIRSEISERPSSAVYIGEEIAAWNLLHNDWAMGAMFVKPQYRGLGYAKIAAADLIKKVLAEGMTPYVQVVQTNKASLSLSAKLGFKLSHEAMWFEKTI